MRNDAFSVPVAALTRPQGHRLALSRAKMERLYQPLAATGVPLGGVGTGGITRSSDGRFSRWTLKAGGVAAFSMPVNGFLLRVRRADGDPAARALQPAADGPEMRAFAFEPEPPEWGGLFPLAWHRHQALQGIVAECLSFSPVIPGDVDSATLPVAVFRWRLTNRGHDVAEASLAFAFANLNGWFDRFQEDRPGRVSAGCFNHPLDLSGGTGVILDRRRVGDVPPEGTGEWAISVAGAPGDVLTRTVCFDGAGTGSDLWDPFLDAGDLPALGAGWVTESGFRETPPAHPAGAVCARVALTPGESREVVATLCWDLPRITFGQGRSWFRAHTDRWGRQGRAAGPITAHAHDNAADWERRVSAWHAETARALGDAPHRAGVAINEAYFLVDGLTVATSAQGSPDGRAHFGIIECHDYALYDTLDLWVYAAEAVARFFPDLAASVARDYCDALLACDAGRRRHRWDATLFPINPAGSCPHDLGGPGEDPFVTPNAYTYRDGTIWKDLNCDLVLCVLREGRAMGAAWRRDRFPAVRMAIEHLQRFDRDGDGLIENDGVPDQTFDNIPMAGPSSYCGGLWIAALLAGAVLAAEAGEPALAAAWRAQAARATDAFDDRLWNGAWFRVDTDGPLSGACFIEQLLGPFLARRLDLGDVVPDDHARRALRTIYERNFLDAGGGEGAVSLTGIDDAARVALPHQEDPSFQTAEIQPGFNFSLAAQLEAWGLAKEADTLRTALHRELYERRNLAFQTPAAFDRGTTTCRAVLNMRPMAAWWMAPGPPNGVDETLATGAVSTPRDTKSNGSTGSYGFRLNGSHRVARWKESGRVSLPDLIRQSTRPQVRANGTVDRRVKPGDDPDVTPRERINRNPYHTRSG